MPHKLPEGSADVLVRPPGSRAHRMLTEPGAECQAVGGDSGKTKTRSDIPHLGTPQNKSRLPHVSHTEDYCELILASNLSVFPCGAWLPVSLHHPGIIPRMVW